MAVVDSVKLTTTILKKSGKLWAITFFSGLIVTICCMFISMYLIVQNQEIYQAYKATGAKGLLGLKNIINREVVLKVAEVELWAAISFFSGLAFIFFYLMLSKVQFLASSVYLLLTSQKEEFTTERIKSFFESIDNAQTIALKGNRVELRKHLINATRKQGKNGDLVSRLKNKAICLLLEKIDMSDVDFNDPSVDLYAVIAQKVRKKISEMEAPQHTFLLGLIFAQSCLCVLAVIAR